MLRPVDFRTTISPAHIAIVEVFSPIRRDPYPPAGYTGARLYAELADLIRRQQSVLVFTNVRSAAEQIGMQLKALLRELSDQIETHHASLDRSVRLEVEDRLKNGELRAVVCSTSLELGIDIGAVDLVIMVATPKGVSRAIQRIGRSGHSLNRTSHGVLVATNVSDLVEAMVTAKSVRDHALDPIHVQDKPYDVVAQHLVGMAALAPIKVDVAFRLIRRAFPFRDLTHEEAKMPLTSGVARAVRKLRTNLAHRLESRSGQFCVAYATQNCPTANDADSIEWLVENYDISVANALAIIEQFRAQRSVSEIPAGTKMLIELYRDGERSHYFFHSLIGRSANDALSRIVAWRVKKRIGGNALAIIDDYGFLLTLRPFQEMPLEDWRLCFEREGAGKTWRERCADRSWSSGSFAATRKQG